MGRAEVLGDSKVMIEGAGVRMGVFFFRPGNYR